MKNLYVFILSSLVINISAQIEGTWKLSSTAYAIACGPSQGNTSWWGNSINDVTTRACLFDDSVKFESNGTMTHYMDGSTWLEPFQGVSSEQCGSPVSPHDGGAATWSFANNQLTVNGLGAHLGLPKVINGPELAAGATVPSSRVYDVTISGNDLILDINGAGPTGAGWWRFTYEKTTGLPPPPSPPIEGTWKLSSTAYAIACGPSQGNTAWWGNSIGDVTTRSCLFDDSITLESNGTMTHYMDSSTWLETFQGVSSEQCGSPVSPHVGGAATWSFANNQLTVNGLGAHFGLAKVINGPELAAGATVPSSRIYEVSFNGNDLILDINGAGPTGAGWWRFTYVKTSGPPPPQTYNVLLQVDASNISVGPNGMYAGGGVLGTANAVALSDSDGDNIWEGTAVFPPQGGNYIFLNSPSNATDWLTKESLNGLPCGDPANYYDRIMPSLTSDSSVCFIWESCNNCSPPTTVVNDHLLLGVKVFPNPANSILTIDYPEKLGTIKVYNTIGSLVFITKPKLNQTKLDISSYNNGLYFIEVISKDGLSSNIKFIKN